VVWYTYPSEEYEFVSWDYSNIWKHGKIINVHLLVNPNIYIYGKLKFMFQSPPTRSPFHPEQDQIQTLNPSVPLFAPTAHCTRVK
jgi:hypothetical protein